MALNFGVTKKPAVAAPIPSMESIFDAYMSFESVDHATDLFLQKGQQLEDALENLCIIGKAMKMHASDEGLAVVKDIVRNELGTTVSVESVKQTAANVWESIKKFFARIGQWISEYFARIANLVLRAEKRLTAIKNKVNELPAGTQLKWSYMGVDVLTESTKNAQAEVDSLKSIISASGSQGKATTFQKDKAAAGRGVQTVEGDKQKTIDVLNGALNLIKYIDAFKKAANDTYTAAKNSIGKAETPDAVAKARNVQKAMNKVVGIVRKQCGVYARTILSVMTHVKVKPGKAAEAPAAK
jgi:oligoribonuclease (3'-5' exoribonuclease)